MILGLADMSSFYPQNDSDKANREKENLVDDSYTDKIKFNDFYPGFK